MSDGHRDRDEAARAVSPVDGLPGDGGEPRLPLDAVPDAVLLAAPGGRWIAANPAAAALLGDEPSRLIGAAAEIVAPLPPGVEGNWTQAEARRG
nr:PAS domain-containing protein [Chloroflexia bacterium]